MERQSTVKLTSEARENIHRNAEKKLGNVYMASNFATVAHFV
jgi:hypothetical protein